jgi:hypothetical protein
MSDVVFSATQPLRHCKARVRDFRMGSPRPTRYPQMVIASPYTDGL